MAISTVTPSMMSIITGIKAKVPNLSLVYTPDLSYESCIEELRASMHTGSTPLSDTDNVPILGFNRGPLRRNEQMGLRSFGDALYTDQTHQELRYLLASYDFRFAFFSNNIEDVEAFEFDYLSRSGISSVSNVNISDVETLGDFPYSVEWGDLNDMVSNIDGSSYSSVDGEAKVSGMFVNSPVDVNLRIETINSSIREQLSILNDTIITIP